MREPGDASWADRHQGLALAGVAALALAVRWTVVLAARPTCDPPTGGEGSCFRLAGDALFYSVQAQLIGDGQYLQHPYEYLETGALADSAGHPPLYPTVLGAFSAVGLDTPTAHRLLSGLMGVLGVVLIALLVRRLAGGRAAVVAGVIGAVYPMLWINDGMLQAEALYVPLVAGVLLAAYAFADRPDLWRAAVLGGLIALATLTRSEALGLFVVLAVPLVVVATRGRPSAGWRGRARLLAVVGGAGLLVLAPYVAYNLARFERTVVLSNSTGSVLQDASCDSTYYGEFIGYHAQCFEDPPLELTRRDESVREAELADRADDYVADHLDRLPVVAVARVTRVFGLFRPGQTLWLDWAIEGRGRRSSQAGVAAYYALIPFAVAGAVALHRRRLTLIPMAAMVLVVVAAAAATFGITRYRVPVDVVLVALAAVGIDAVWRRWGPAAPPP